MDFLVAFLISFLLHNGAFGQDRRPTISFITQPEIVTDIGGTVEMKCSVQYGDDYPIVWMKLDQVDRNNDLPISSGKVDFMIKCQFRSPGCIIVDLQICPLNCL